MNHKITLWKKLIQFWNTPELTAKMLDFLEILQSIPLGRSICWENRAHRSVMFCSRWMIQYISEHPFRTPMRCVSQKNIQGKAKTTSPQVRIIIFDSGAIGLRLRCTSSRFLCCRIALLNICRSMQIGSTFRFAYFCIRCGWLVFFSYLLHGWFFIKF